MAVLQRASKPQPDVPPLWLPRHDIVVVEQASARPPDFVDGYTLPSRFMAVFLGSRWKMATMGATAAAVALFIALLPSLVGAGIGALLKLAFYQAWTLAVLLLVTVRVRSIGVGTVARYWLSGTFLVAMLASFLNDPLAGLSENGVVWITPVLEEILKALPLAVAVFMGRRTWRHPGLSDLMILGFAVGAGYAFHEEALWERVAASGFDLNAGLAVPTIFQTSGLVIVGQAVWASMIALAIGLFVLHRRQAVFVVAATTIVLVVVGDRMAVNDGGGTLAWVRQLLFNGTLTAVLFILAVAAAVTLDQRRLAATSARDHLFPSDHTHGPTLHDPDADDDPLASFLAARYRRLRNGVHTTVDATTQQWPPRAEAHPAPLAELARLGRAADVAVGPSTSPNGWARDPESPKGFRFVGPNGFTAYAASEQIVESANVPVPVAVAAREDHTWFGDSDLGDRGAGEITPADLEASAAAASAPASTLTRVAKKATSIKQAASATRARRAVPIGPTTASISVPKARPEAHGSHLRTRPSDFWHYVGLATAAVGLFTLVRLLTAAAASTAVLDTPISLADAVNGPPMIVGLLGAVATAVSIRGRDAAELHEGWEVGPGRDPSTDRPDECEA